MDIWAWAWWNSDRGYEADALHAVAESRPFVKGVCHLSKRHGYWLVPEQFYIMRTRLKYSRKKDIPSSKENCLHGLEEKRK